MQQSFEEEEKKTATPTIVVTVVAMASNSINNKVLSPYTATYIFDDPTNYPNPRMRYHR